MLISGAVYVINIQEVRLFFSTTTASITVMIEHCCALKTGFFGRMFVRAQTLVHGGAATTVEAENFVIGREA
jgi:hypothetical protein